MAGTKEGGFRYCPLTGESCEDPRCKDACWGEIVFGQIKSMQEQGIDLLSYPQTGKSLLDGLSPKVIKAIEALLHSPVVDKRRLEFLTIF